MAQLKAAATKPAARADRAGGRRPKRRRPRSTSPTRSRIRCEAVSASQAKAERAGQGVSRMGDDSVSLSDVMIAMQKASINFQATVQVRNKLVSAYHEIMNMQV